MKKIINFTFAFFCFLYSLNAQVAYSDAIKLKAIFSKPITPQTYQDISTILAQYLPPKTTDTTADLVRLKYLSNPFINSTTLDLSSNYFQYSAPAASLPLGNLISTLGNTNISTAADGVTKFLIKRAKQELLISFFSNLQDTSKYPEFRILFPNTKILIDNFNAWEYANIINTLKEAFNKDMQQLLGGIPNINSLDENDKKYNEQARNRIRAVKKFYATDEGRLFISALQIGNGFTTKQKIPDIVHTITSTSYLAGLTSINPDEKNILRLLDILSYSVRSNVNGKNYITSADFATLTGDADLTKIYLGLLYAQLKNENVTIGGTDIATTFLQTIGTSFNNTKGIYKFIDKLIKETDKLNDAYTKLTEAKNKGETDLSPYWAAIFQNANYFFQSVIDLQTIDPAFKFPPAVQKALTLSTNTLEIANDIAIKNYNAAIVTTLTFISQNLKTTDDISDFKTFFVKYGSMAANIIDAKNSDDAEKAIEAAALPVGSASIKKKTRFNIALNAYLGGFCGSEYLSEKKENKWAPISGVYAPIGVTLSKRLWNAGSISGFISAVDLGAIASFRLQDATTEKLPDITLQNILAPGLGVIYGLPKCPLSIGYSYQFGPALRSINATDKVVSDQVNHRWQFFLAVDIPLFNFYTKSK